MADYKIKIDLLSDLCVSDGGVYNSSLDLDVCYDEYGFPYIPAKRLKGCLRESALELKDWGADIAISKIFGDKGDKNAVVRIGNAYLEDYEEIRDCIQYEENKQLFHAQNILNYFSYIRTQTAINYYTGVADKTSLRTMRVVKKGLIFEAEIELPEIYADDMENICSVTKHMGIARTRGFGEVNLSLEKNETMRKNKGTISCEEGDNYLRYRIILKEPVICKSINGGEANTQDFLEGGKILGIVAQALKKEEKNIADIINDGTTVFSNAYLEYQGKRMTEVPACIFSIKNNKVEFVNKMYSSKEKEEEVLKKRLQLNQMSHCYVRSQNGKLIKKDVMLEERYHHRRPDDKGIGRAMSSDSSDSHFYQISSISKGQVFQGFIIGKPENIRQICDGINKHSVLYLGYGKSAEYGMIEIQVIETGKRKKNKKKIKNFIVKLEAPALIYNDKAMYSTFVEDLENEVNCALNINDEQIEQIIKYVRYGTIGGYNVTWNARKPFVKAFDKGTVLQYQLKEAIEVEIEESFYIGERIQEGLGECSLEIIGEQDDYYWMKASDSLEQAGTHLRTEKKNAVVEQILYKQFLEFVKISALTAAEEFKISKPEVLKPTISNMILMAKESDSISVVKTTCKDRFSKKSMGKDEKLLQANEILKQADQMVETLLDKFVENYHLSAFSCEKKQYEMECLLDYLRGLKYRLRGIEKKKEENNE